MEEETLCKSCMQPLTEHGQMDCMICAEACCLRCYRDHRGTCGWPDCKEQAAQR